MSTPFSYLAVALGVLCFVLPGSSEGKKRKRGVPPAQIEVGIACELSRQMKMGSKPKGKGRRIRVRKGEQVEVVEVNRGWVTVSAGEKTAFTRRKNLARACKIVEPPEDAPQPPAPEPEELDDPELAAIEDGEPPGDSEETAALPAEETASPAEAAQGALADSPEEGANEPSEEPGSLIPESDKPPPSSGGGITDLLSAIQAPGTVPTFQPAPEVRATRTRKKSSVSRAPLYVATLGIAGAGVGAVLLGLGKKKGKALREDILAYNQSAVRAAADERDLQSRKDQVATFDVTSVALLGAGGAALGVGFIMWLARDDEPSTSTRFSNLGISPSLGPTGDAGLLVRGEF